MKYEQFLRNIIPVLLFTIVISIANEQITCLRPFLFRFVSNIFEALAAFSRNLH